MINKTARITRLIRDKGTNREHSEVVLIEIWWLLWIVPLYRSETVIRHNL